MKPEDMRLYELYTQMIDRVNEDVNHHHIFIYHPDAFIELAKENASLLKEIERLRNLERKYQYELEQGINLLDKLKWCGESLDNLGIGIPFRLDGSPR